MEQYIDIAEQAFAEKIQQVNDIWQITEPGSNEEFITHLACSALEDMEENLAKRWNPSQVADVLDLLIPALTEIKERIQDEPK